MGNDYKWLDEVPREELEMQAYSLGVQSPDSYSDEELKAAIQGRREHARAASKSQAGTD